MRIAVATHTMAGRGGLERTVELQVRGLRRRGHEVELVCGPSLGSGRVARAASGALLAARGPRRLRSFDVVLAHYAPAPWLACRSGVPFVYFFHHPFRGAYPTPLQQKRPSFRAWHAAVGPLGQLEDRAVRAAASVLVPSPSVAAELMDLHAITAEVAPIGVDTSLFAPDPDVANEGHLLFVGRLDEGYKHLDWASFVAERLGLNLRAVGPGRPRRGPLGSHVHLVGRKDGAALVEEYRRAAALVFPSVGEDYGLVPLEALACGLPVVAFDDGHGPSTTLRGESGGVLVTPVDLDALARAVADSLRPARRAELVALGPAWVQAHYSLEHHLSVVEGKLLEALKCPVRL